MAQSSMGNVARLNTSGPRVYLDTASAERVPIPETGSAIRFPKTHARERTGGPMTIASIFSYPGRLIFYRTERRAVVSEHQL